jgi:hypothetical protein
MPKVRVQRVSRTWLNPKQYEQGRKQAQTFAREATEAGDAKEASKWDEADDFLEFMVGTFLRASEWAALKHQHIEVVTENRRSYLKIAVTNGKTKPRFAISMPEAVDVYKRIVARVGSDPDTYLFLPEYPNRYTASKHIRMRFGKLLDATKLKVDGLAQNRVTYCLRHSAIMFRVLEGVDSLLLARNAGTSVEQIELHYASQYTAEMRVDELHKTKGGGPGAPTGDDYFKAKLAALAEDSAAQQYIALTTLGSMLAAPAHAADSGGSPSV